MCNAQFYISIEGERAISESRPVPNDPKPHRRKPDEFRLTLHSKGDFIITAPPVDRNLDGSRRHIMLTALWLFQHSYYHSIILIELCDFFFKHCFLNTPLSLQF